MDLYGGPRVFGEYWCYRHHLIADLMRSIQLQSSSPNPVAYPRPVTTSQISLILVTNSPGAAEAGQALLCLA